MRNIADILKELDEEIHNDSYFEAETLDEFDKLQNEHYSKISKLVSERNQAYAEIEAEKYGLKIERS